MYYRNIKLAAPFDFTIIKVGLGGRHYHTEDCWLASPETGFGGELPKGVSNYAKVEVPLILIQGQVPIRYLDRDYVPCPGCMLKGRRRNDAHL